MIRTCRVCGDPIEVYPDLDGKMLVVTPGTYGPLVRIAVTSAYAYLGPYIPENPYVQYFRKDMPRYSIHPCPEAKEDILYEDYLVRE